MLVMGEPMHVWGQRVYEKSMYLPLNFVINLHIAYVGNSDRNRAIRRGKGTRFFNDSKGDKVLQTHIDIR